MSFGPADLAASRRMKTTRVGGGHPGYRVIEDPDPENPDAPRASYQQDPWHYSIARMVDACTSVGDPALLRPVRRHQATSQGCETQFRAAFLLGCVGAWSLHPVPDRDRQEGLLARPRRGRFAKKVIEAIPDGRGVHMIDGKMQDDATWKQCKVMVDLAEMLAAKDPELAEAYGFAAAAAEAAPQPPGARRTGFRAACASSSTSPAQIVARAGIPRHRATASPRRPSEARRIAERDRRPGGHQVPGADRRADEGRRRASSPTRPRRPKRHAERHPRRSRSTATCRAACWSTPRAEVEQEYYAGVVWDGIRKQPVMLFSRHGRDRHRGGRRGAPRPRRPRGTSPTCCRSRDFEAKQVIASIGVTGSALNRLTPILARLARLFVELRHDAGRDQPAGASSRTARSSRSTPTWTWRTRPARARRRC